MHSRANGSDPTLDAAVASLALVPLDAAQRRIAELPAGRATLVLGEAGHGKTTVAIHRLAHLARAAARQGQAFRAVFVVPSEGLRALIERALVRLGVDVPVLTFDQFARRQARRAFGDLPKRESVDATPATARLKRDPALGDALAVLAARAPGRIDDDEEAPPPPTRANVMRGDLQHLFGDRELLARVGAASNGRIPAHAIAETLEHTRVQFGLTSEEAFAHVDKKRLKTADRRALDEGTPEGDAATVDAEDYAVLFALDRLRAQARGGKATRPRAYDCVVIDEAQELAPIELALLGRSVRGGGTLVVAGDADQQLDDRACFAGWGETMRALGAEAYEQFVLDVGYRCPPDVVALARAALAGTALPVRAFAGEAALVGWLGERLARQVDGEAKASIAVIVREAKTARRIAEALRAHLPVRLVWGGDFRFAPGVDVTTVDQVRGLEFDHVVVPDAGQYDGAVGRRALYVAITRARGSVELAAGKGS